MSEKFIKKDIEHKKLDGSIFIEKDVLCFEFKRDPENGASVGVEQCDRATEAHKKGYPKAWQKFLESEATVAEVKAEVAEASQLSAGTIEEAQEEKPKKGKKSKVSEE